MPKSTFGRKRVVWKTVVLMIYLRFLNHISICLYLVFVLSACTCSWSLYLVLVPSSVPSPSSVLCPFVPWCSSRRGHRRALSVRPLVRPVVVARPLSVRPVICRVVVGPLAIRPIVFPVVVRPVTSSSIRLMGGVGWRVTQTKLVHNNNGRIKTNLL